MSAQAICFSGLIALVACQNGGGHGHEAHSSQQVLRHDGPSHEVKVEVHDPHGKGHHVVHDCVAYPHYEFKYEVKDPHTHDIKSQHEQRKGDHLQGSYSLHEYDGSVRKVDYQSDEKTGFQASIKHETHHVVPEHHHHH